MNRDDLTHKKMLDGFRWSQRMRLAWLAGLTASEAYRAIRVPQGSFFQQVHTPLAISRLFLHWDRESEAVNVDMTPWVV